MDVALSECVDEFCGIENREEIIRREWPSMTFASVEGKNRSCLLTRMRNNKSNNNIINSNTNNNNNKNSKQHQTRLVRMQPMMKLYDIGNVWIMVVISVCV